MRAAPALHSRELARRRLSHFLFEYIDEGSHAEGRGLGKYWI
jgi:L-lactate dehydrogenase (cytochrome)